MQSHHQHYFLNDFFLYPVPLTIICIPLPPPKSTFIVPQKIFPSSSHNFVNKAVLLSTPSSQQLSFPLYPTSLSSLIFLFATVTFHISQQSRIFSLPIIIVSHLHHTHLPQHIPLPNLNK